MITPLTKGGFQTDTMYAERPKNFDQRGQHKNTTKYEN